MSGSSSTLKVIGELLNSQDEYMALANPILSLTLICRALKLLIPDACLPGPSSTSTQQKAPNVDLTVREQQNLLGNVSTADRWEGNRWKIGLKALGTSVMLQGLQIAGNEHSKSCSKIIQGLLLF